VDGWRLAAGQRSFHVEDSVPGPDLSINATIMDLGGITKTGAGELDLFQANTYRGATLVQAGTLGILNNNALGATSEGTTVADGATVAFGLQADTVLEPFTIVGAGVGGTNGALVTVADVWINTNIVLSGAAAIRTEGMNSQIQVNDISGNRAVDQAGQRTTRPPRQRQQHLFRRHAGQRRRPGPGQARRHRFRPRSPHHRHRCGRIEVPSARVEHRSSFTIVGSVTVNAGGLWDLNGAAEGFSIPALEGRPPLTLNDGGSVQTGAGIFFLPVGGDMVVNPGLFGSSTISGRIGLDAGSHRISVGQRGFSLLEDLIVT
jgi:autotransporter-associated beta strand protein